MLENDPGSAIRTGAGTEEDDAHLGPASEIPEASFVVNGRHLFLDLERAFDQGFRDWLLNEAPDNVLARANPQDVVIRNGDGQGRTQFEKIREWNLGNRNGPA